MAHKKIIKKSIAVFNTSRKLVTWIFIYSALTLCFYILSGKYLAQSSNEETKQLAVSVDSTTDIVKGNENAVITIVAYFDYLSPTTIKYNRLLNIVNDKRPDSVRIVYRGFPQDQLYPKSSQVTSWVANVYKQKKSWEMIGAILAKQPDIQKAENTDEILKGILKDLKLDEKVFNETLANEDSKARVTSDFYSAIGSGVNRAPSFFLNNQPIQLPTSEIEILRMIDEKVDNIKANPPQGL